MWQLCFTISDAPTVALLLFLCKYFDKLSHCYDGLKEINNDIPKTLRGAGKLIGLTNDHFTQYIVCQSCDSVFNSDFGYVMEHGQKVPNKYPHIAMPNHPFPSQRHPCGSLLMRTIRGRGGHGNVMLRPNKVYPYQSLIGALTMLMSRDGFLDCCEHWRKRVNTMPSHVLADIYEGKVWSDFFVVDGVSFLQSPYNLCFTMNVDWFQPFTHTSELL